MNKVVEALKQEDAIIKEAQNILGQFLRPGRPIQTEKDAINGLLELFDGPRQRDAQALTHEAIPQAEAMAEVCEAYGELVKINPDSLAGGKRIIAANKMMSAWQKLQQLQDDVRCEHGALLASYCLPCNRIHGAP